MDEINTFEVIIIGGSYAGLSAAMTLGRSLRSVLIIDANSPCNRSAPNAHNLVGFDGEPPEVIAEKAKAQVLKYHTVTYLNARAVAMSGHENDFEVVTDSGLRFAAKKVLLSTGVSDILPEIDGIAECWGKTAVHCPYCHGYEIAGKKIAILTHGEAAFEMTKLIRQWSKELLILTNGNDDMEPEHLEWLGQKNIPVIKTPVTAVDHVHGVVSKVMFSDGTSEDVEAIYVRAGVTQQMDIPLHMGCEFDDHGFIIVDDNKKTNIPGMFAAGDNTTATRTLSYAIAAGTVAGIHINKELIEENFNA
ncbi:MAG TPA: NAD(P)/FAD-dependent oxidoreductase [Flavobacterium sp.]|jgi:thioredoxin reductase